MTILKEDDAQDSKVDLKNSTQNNTNSNPQFQQKPVNYRSRYTQAKTVSNKQKVIKDFFNSLNLSGPKQTDFDQFVHVNLGSLCIEIDKYGLTTNNPFVKFLYQYIKYNNSIAPFTQTPDRWNVLHNSISGNLLTTKQIAFTCSELEQPRILLNKSLWGISPVSDIFACIKLYAKIIDQYTDLNSIVKNGYVKAAFSNGAITDINNPSMQDAFSPDMNSKENRMKLLKCLFLADTISQLTKDNVLVNAQTNEIPKDGLAIIDQARKKVLTANNKSLIGSSINNVDLIEEQSLLLYENVQLSNRDVNGQYQKTDTDDRNKYNKTQVKNKKTTNANNSQTSSYPDMIKLIDSDNNFKKLIDSIDKTLRLNKNKNDILKALDTLTKLVKNRL